MPINEEQRIGNSLLVDPRGCDYPKYRGATALTPNKLEIAEAFHVDVRDTPELMAAASQLREELQLDFHVVTRGEEGILLIEAAHTPDIPATARQVFDVSGAGDTVIATLAARLMTGFDHSEALEFANLTDGVAVGKAGTVPISHQELLHELTREEASGQADKICDLDTLLARLAAWRTQGQRIVFTHVC